MRRLPVSLGLQIILWHDLAAGRTLKWSHSMDNGRGAVDIAAQMKATLKQADESNGDN